MWAVIGKYLVQAGIWALSNPDKVENGIADVHALVDAIHAAKQVK